MEESKKEIRKRILKDLGFYIQYEHFSDKHIEFASKDIRDSWNYQHHEFNGKKWYSFDIHSKRGILSIISDEEFNEWIASIPELERKAHEGFAEWLKDAEYHDSIKKGNDAVENKNQAEDRETLAATTEAIKTLIENTNFKSMKFKVKGVFSKISDNLEELNKL